MVGVTVWLSVLVGKGAGRVGGVDISLRLRGGVEGVVEEWTTVAVRGSLLQHVARLHIVVHLWARFRHCQPKACSPIHYGWWGHTSSKRWACVCIGKISKAVSSLRCWWTYLDKVVVWSLAELGLKCIVHDIHHSERRLLVWQSPVFVLWFMRSP